MKATELMIWDWVYNSYHKKNIQWNYGEMFCPNGNPVIGKDLYPIPLTAEILEKNGWKWRTRYDIESLKLLSEDGHCLMSLTYGKKISVGGHEIEIKYVHELQHALRLCGLNELADNFQI